jgi:hypothetical protein
MKSGSDEAISVNAFTPCIYVSAFNPINVV